ncbi:MobC family plasmid mobilization relaxosome protein [Acidaminobacter sp. JC074]|uniref:MobC family plasmid mobilization relaxosome protein n=1 Tax=Acidaminobacter sp. JC074 TaxID=2530199 RepID=UPI001F0D3D14|nr:MobC family plasmid mobilization relaxosome protein [Acidaminobacter sp. JC074]MCH4888930.1 MobC family plasmid mobilization relaxosome protein [Acidaminobacter sp. JC074]
MAQRTRPLNIHVMVTEEEKQLIEHNRKVAGFKNTGAYMRKMAIDGRIFKIDHTPLQDISSKMTKASTNINQIAKRVNSTDSIYKEDIQELKEMTEEIWQSLKSILSKLP